MEIVEELPKWKIKRVLCYGHSRALTLTPFLPEDWEHVKVRLEAQGRDEFTIRVKKLG